jgi:phage anti-repressor protein
VSTYNETLQRASRFFVKKCEDYLGQVLRDHYPISLEKAIDLHILARQESAEWASRFFVKKCEDYLRQVLRDHYHISLEKAIDLHILTCQESAEWTEYFIEGKSVMFISHDTSKYIDVDLQFNEFMQPVANTRIRFPKRQTLHPDTLQPLVFMPQEELANHIGEECYFWCEDSISTKPREGKLQEIFKMKDGTVRYRPEDGAPIFEFCTYRPKGETDENNTK